MSRDDFQLLAEEKLQDARALLNAGRFNAAYHFTGYVVECARKACISKQTVQYDFPPKDASKYYTHNLEQLGQHAGLSGTLEGLGARWSAVKDWSEESRYRSHGEKRARDMMAAVSDPDGVLECIKQYW